MVAVCLLAHFLLTILRFSSVKLMWDCITGISHDELQGFYFSKGIPGPEATKLLQSGVNDDHMLWKNRKGV